MVPLLFPFVGEETEAHREGKSLAKGCVAGALVIYTPKYSSLKQAFIHIVPEYQESGDSLAG